LDVSSDAMSDYLLTVDQKNDLLVRPGELRDRYQSALCELVEAKTKGLATTPRAIAEPPKVINLMEALKRSVARGAEPEPNTAEFGEAGMRPILRSIRSGRISAWSMRPGIGTRLTARNEQDTELLSAAKRQNCILQCPDAWEPQGCGRGIEAAELPLQPVTLWPKQFAFPGIPAKVG